MLLVNDTACDVAAISPGSDYRLWHPERLEEWARPNDRALLVLVDVLLLVELERVDHDALDS